MGGNTGIAQRFFLLHLKQRRPHHEHDHGQRQFWKDLTLPFYGYNRPGAKISEGVRESFWLQGMMCGFPGAYFCIKALDAQNLFVVGASTYPQNSDYNPTGPLGALSLRLGDDLNRCAAANALKEPLMKTNVLLATLFATSTVSQQGARL